MYLTKDCHYLTYPILKPLLRKTLRITAWTLGSILALFLLLVVLIQVPYIQNLLKDKAVAYLEGKIHTKVRLDRIEIGLPKKVIVEGLYLEDQQRDTLLYGGKIKVDIGLFGLIRSDINIQSVDLEDVTANIHRDAQGRFNFDYIVEAFASPEPKKASEPTQIDLGRIHLSRTKLRFDDRFSGNDLYACIGDLQTEIKEFDLQKSVFSAPDINVDGLVVRLKQRQAAAHSDDKAPKSENAAPLTLLLDKIELNALDFSFDSDPAAIALAAKWNTLLLKVNELDLHRQTLDLDRLKLDGATAFVRKKKGVPATDTPSTTTADHKWKITLREIGLADIAFRYDDDNAAPVTNGIDYAHLDLSGLSFDARNITYSSKAIAARVRSLKARERSGLHLRDFRTDVAYATTGIVLSNLYLETNDSTIQNHLAASWPSLSALKAHPEALSVDADLRKTRLAFTDILRFAPQLARQKPFASYPNGTLYLDTKISGPLADLYIPRLQLSGLGQTRLDASGRVKGLPDASKLALDLNIRDFRLGEKDATKLLPPNALPSSIRLPETFALKGSFKGTLAQFRTRLSLGTSSGNAQINAVLDRRITNRERYDAQVTLDRFDLGRLLRNDSIGTVTLDLKAKGMSFNPRKATGELKGRVVSAAYKGYTYRNLALSGKANAGKIQIAADMKDPNLTFALAGQGDFGGKAPAVMMRLQVDMADLEKLHLHAGPLKLRGTVDADFPVADPDDLNGRLVAHHLFVANATEQFPLDSIRLEAVSTAGRDSISVQSQFLSARLTGKYALTKLPGAIQKSLSRYFPMTATATATDPQSADLEVNLKNDPLLFKLLPQLKNLEPATIKAAFRSETDSITLDVSIPKIVYGNITISGVKATAETTNDGLSYNLLVDNAKSGSVEIPYTRLQGLATRENITYDLLLRDVKDKDRYRLSGTLRSDGPRLELWLDPATLQLNYDNWTIPESNRVSFGPGGLFINELRLENKGSVIDAQSTSVAPNAPIQVAFDQFDLRTLTAIIQSKALDVSGTIDGTVDLRDLNGTAQFNSDLEIRQLTLQNKAIGDIILKVDNAAPGTLRGKLRLTGNGNDLQLDGTYTTASGNVMATLDLSHLEMASVEALSVGNLSDSEGFLSGQIRISGAAASPSLVGELRFNEVGFRTKQLRSKFTGISETIAFDGNAIRLDRFTLHDTDGNELVVDGTVLNDSFKRFGLDLSVNSRHFKLVDSKERDNDLFYGKLYADANLRVKGDSDSPVVNGKIAIADDTDFTVVLPQQDPSIQDREGIVKFVDRDGPDMIDERVTLSDTLGTSSFRGIDASVDIEVNKDATLSLIIDKGNGDYLKLKGEARLTGGIDPSGKTTLTGRYEFTEGAYEMTFNLIRRKFDIKDGSYILWTGEPTSADVNITAVYRAEAAPIDLVENQIANLSPEQRNRYKQRIPFDTQLKMNGQLMKPDITFDIVIPEGNYNVATEVTDAAEAQLARLRQEPSELNKQVFALLLLNRFIGQNPFSSEAGGTSAESLARQSASKILSQQLNNLAADLISGVEVNFDLESTDDYTTGQLQNRTDLTVGVSKRLLNDRIKVSVGSNFGLEGPQQANEQTNNIAGDVSVDYQLTKDGRYLVRAYRKNQYEVALQGQVVETGVAFIITMDYKKFRELFHRSEEEKALRAERRQKAREEKQEKRKSENDQDNEKKL